MRALALIQEPAVVDKILRRLRENGRALGDGSAARLC
jgi:hypothetical protein